MQRLLLLGLNHTTAPLDVRERVAFSPEQQLRAIQLLRSTYPAAEFALISTCNRVEVYAARSEAGSPDVEQMLRFLADFHGISADSLHGHTYEKTQRAVVEHLFAVASSLDSMVLGEREILGQVRAAYELSGASSAAGTELNPLFQRAIAVGREVMNNTALGSGRVSVASVAVDYSKRIFDQFSTKTVLCIGAGKMSQLVLSQFQSLGVGRLLICNRDPEKASALAERFSGQPAPFDELPDHLAQADIVISSTGARQPIISRSTFEAVLRRRRYRQVFLIDLAVPRDIESGVGELQGAFLYNLDDLQEEVSRTQARRSDAVADARAVVTRHVDDFVRWNRARELGPAIDSLYKRSHALAKEELERTMNRLSNLTAADRAQLEDLTRRIVNKLLHDPVRALRDADGAHAATSQYLHAVDKLFGLTDSNP
jgi:glutamyl-tRNA reductase